MFVHFDYRDDEAPQAETHATPPTPRPEVADPEPRPWPVLMRELWRELDTVRSRDARRLGPRLRALHTELGAACRAGDPVRRALLTCTDGTSTRLDWLAALVADIERHDTDGLEDVNAWLYAVREVRDLVQALREALAAEAPEGSR